MQHNSEQKTPFLALFKKASSIIYLVIICALLQLTPSLIYYARSPKSAVTPEQVQDDVKNLYKQALKKDQEDLDFIKSIAAGISVPLSKVWIDPEHPQLIHCSTEKGANRKKFAIYLHAASQKRVGPSKELKPLISDPDQYTFLSLAKDESPSTDTFTIFRSSIEQRFSPVTVEKEQITEQSKEKITQSMEQKIHDLLLTRPSALGISPAFTDFLQEKELTTENLKELAKEVLFWEKHLQNNPQSHAFFTSVIKKSLPIDKTKVASLKSVFQTHSEKLSERLSEQIEKSKEKDSKEEDSTAELFSEQLDAERLRRGAKAIEFLLSKEKSKTTLENHPLFSSISSDSEAVTIENKVFSDENDSQLSFQRALSLATKAISQATDFQLLEDGPHHYKANSPLKGQQKGAFLFTPSFLSFEKESGKVRDLFSRIKPKSKELDRNNFPLIDQSVDQQSLPYMGLRIAKLNQEPIVILEGVRPLLDTLKSRDDKQLTDLFLEDITSIDLALNTLGYQIQELSLDEIALLWPSDETKQRYQSAAVYRCTSPLNSLSALSRLQWKNSSWQSDQGLKMGALFHLDSQENRLKLLNRIDDAIHEEHLQERDSYEKAQSDLNKEIALLHPKPPHNLLLDNLLLSIRKVIRGDQESALKWGLDLYGGKTVRIALEDSAGKKATEQAQLEQAQSELGSRLNKLGLSEVAIRIEGEYLVLDFPSSQNMKASELIEAAKMRFHVVNETFSSANINLSQEVHTFLNEVIGEVQQKTTGQLTMENLTDTAAYLLGYGENGVSLPARTAAAKKLKEKGLKVLPISQYQPDSLLETENSLVLPQRSSEPNSRLQSPLIVFANHALSGKDLETVKGNYDPEHGHTLGFSVSSSPSNKSDETTNPQEVFATWTKHFSTSGIRKTPYESTTQGRGWRMAVALNGEIVSAPTLSTELRDQAMIHGSFSEREVQHLVSDLKAGALSFTPKILSEENISPELGAKDRSSGLYAALFGFALVVVLMSGYYGFAGRVASCAVFFNLLLTWAILQYLGAALTLSGIAALVLTVGMSVDANVLIFERMREELAKNVSLKGAIKAGYSRAYSAIIDSNLTTILAALILIQFDSGPIKGFAITLIVGVGSSMFTALFMTKTFFESWSQKSGRELNLHRWLPEKIHFDFFKWQKPVSILWALFTLSGLFLIYEQRATVLGMDFTGGYSIEMTFSEQAQPGQDRRESVRAALEKAGIEGSFIEMREFEGSARMKLQLHGAVDQSVFQKMDLSPSGTAQRIAFVKKALESEGLLLEETIDELETKSSSVSGQFSSLMRQNALTAIAVALVAILIYLAARFEWRFALSAVAGLGCDVLATLSAIGWLRLMGMPIKLDLQAIGAIMTIIGYALNDTIIIFDRIRESGSCHLGSRPARTINKALCETLSRTLMTSGTTLVALISLNVLGGQGLLSFSMIMTTGILVGTFCSLFITSYILRQIWKTLGNSKQIEIEKSTI